MVVSMMVSMCLRRSSLQCAFHLPLPMVLCLFGSQEERDVSLWEGMTQQGMDLKIKGKKNGRGEGKKEKEKKEGFDTHAVL